MNSEGSKQPGGSLALLRQDMENARKHWWMFLVLGIVLMIGGVVAIAYP